MTALDDLPVPVSSKKSAHPRYPGYYVPDLNKTGAQNAKSQLLVWIIVDKNYG